jgi:long-chain fatty acid transport protein
MKKAGTLFCAVALLAFLSPLAMANGLNLNSLGSKALSMGGAFVGLADDFSTIFWNPAGIAQFKNKYFGFYGADLIPSSTFKMDAIVPGVGKVNLVDAKSATKHYLSGMGTYYHPISENLVVGFGVYVPSGLGIAWDGTDFQNVSMNKAYDWSSKVGTVTFAPALAYQVNDMFMIGAALNINYGMFDIATHAGKAQVGSTVFDLGQYEESLTGWGIGATLGVLVKPNDMFSIGATLRTPSTVKFDGKASISNLGLLGLNGSSDLSREVTSPLWLAGGIAFKPMDQLTLTFDAQYTNWKKIQEVEANYKDPFWKLLMNQAGKDVMEMFWKDAIQFRFGGEYRINEGLALRAGFYHDPSPAPERTMNVLIPSYSFNVLTLGLGYKIGGLQIDAAFEYLKSDQREVDFLKTQTDPEWASAMPGVYNLKIIVPNISLSYKF